MLAALAGRAGLPVVATGNVHYAAPAPARLGRRARRGPRPAQPRRDGRLAARGRRPRTCAPAPRWPLRFARYPGRSSAAAGSAASARSTSARRARSCPPFPVPRRPHRGELAARAAPAGRRRRYGPPRRAGTRCVRPDRPRARRDRAARLPRLLPDRVGHRRVLPATTTSCCQGRGSAANSAVCYALGITTADAVRYDLLFERFLSPERDGPARHRPGHRVRPPRGGDPVRLRSATAAQTRHRSPTSSPTGPDRRCVTWRRALGHSHGPAGRLVQADRPLGLGRPTPTDHDIPATCWSWPSRCVTSPAISASTPAAW